MEYSVGYTRSADSESIDTITPLGNGEHQDSIAPDLAPPMTPSEIQDRFTRKKKKIPRMIPRLSGGNKMAGDKMLRSIPTAYIQW